jgi:glycosyltransferase involved in cell wall biosynthesis
LITVFLFSYNHSSFIEQAVDSILAQVTSFNFKIIICDDFSTDKTQDLLLNYKERYPDKISLILREKNLGYQKSILYALNYCDTKYIAILEGDDFWSDSNKLQKQVTYLEQNPDCSLCTHWIKTKDQTGNGIHEDSFSSKDKPQTFDKDFLFLPNVNTSPKGTGYHMLSWVFRTNHIKEIPSWIVKIRGFDDVMFVVLLQHGYCYCIQSFMGTYRLNDKSSWTNLNSRVKGIAQLYFLFRIRFSFPNYSKKISDLLYLEAKGWKNWPLNFLDGKIILNEVIKITLKDLWIGILLLYFVSKILLNHAYFFALSYSKIKIGKLLLK